MTSARTSAGDKITITQAGNTNLTTATVIKELKTAPAIGGTPSQIDATSLDDTECKVYIPGLSDYGMLDFTFNLIPSGETGSNFDVLSKVDKSKPCVIEYTLTNHKIKISLDKVYVDFEIGTAGVDSARELIMHCTMADGPEFTTVS